MITTTIHGMSPALGGRSITFSFGDGPYYLSDHGGRFANLEVAARVAESMVQVAEACDGDSHLPARCLLSVEDAVAMGWGR